MNKKNNVKDYHVNFLLLNVNDQTKPLILFRTAQETVQYQHERHRIQDSSPEKGQKI